MKKIILTAGICMVSLFYAQAQQANAKASIPFDQKVNKMVGVLTATCKLSADQVAKVQPIIAQAMKEKMANREQYSTDKQKLKAANQATRKETNEKLDAILTPEQQSKLAAFEQQRKAQIQKNKAAGTGSQK